MRVAVVGSRTLTVPNLGDYLPENVSEIVSGGARGVDQCARAYALAHGIKLTEYLPDYARHGRRAPLMRNDQIVARAELVLAFWDGCSRGTVYTIRHCRAMGVPCRVFMRHRKAVRLMNEPNCQNACGKPT